MLTNDATRCPYYKAESANVKPRFGCVMSSDFLVENFPRITLPNTKEACEVGQVAQWGENFIVYNENNKKGKEIIIQILCKEKCVRRWGRGWFSHVSTLYLHIYTLLCPLKWKHNINISQFLGDVNLWVSGTLDSHEN